MKAIFLLVSICWLCLCACQTESKTDTQKQAPQAQLSKTEVIKPFASRLDSLVKKGGGPCTSDSDCMNVKAVWPVIEHGSEAVRKLLNDSIILYVHRQLSYDPDEAGDDLNVIMDKLIADYKREYDETQGFGMGWTMETNGKIDFHDELANLELANYSFMGGAHPNYYIQYVNFNTTNGKVITYDDFIKDRAAFEQLIQKKFLAQISDMTEEQMSIEDFFWGEGFQLAKNFKLGKESLELLYNPYEAAAYALGSISINLPYDELQGIIER